jgi:phytoene dehydrogenase-like protein
VLVLEKNGQCGGGVVSIDIAPGFIHDPHASGYYLCIANPAVKDDELGLKALFGLTWKTWDAGFATIFDSGDGLVAYRDLDRTCEAVARYSHKDAATYRRFAGECMALLPLLSKSAATPPLPTGPFITLLDQSAAGRRLVDMMFQSVYDILENLFETDEVRIHLSKWCAEAMEGPEVKGTGVTLVNLLGLAHSFDAHIPVGGSRAVTNALLKCIEHYGGAVRTNATVAQVLVSRRRKNHGAPCRGRKHSPVAARRILARSRGSRHRAGRARRPLEQPRRAESADRAVRVAAIQSRSGALVAGALHRVCAQGSHGCA